VVTLTMELPETAAPKLAKRLNEAGMGRLAWVDNYGMDN